MGDGGLFGPPGWPVLLSDPVSGVVLRPYRRSDATVWSQTRCANEEWLAPWEPTAPRMRWADLNSPSSFKVIYRELRRAARAGTAMPFAIWLGAGTSSHQGGARSSPAERFVGQVTLGNIVRRAFCSAYAGYWVDSRVAGQGIMPTAVALVVDHAFAAGGLHRIEVNIRPDNVASRRVVEKLGFREESYHKRYLHIDGAWRDHVGYALTAEDVADDGGLLARWHRERLRIHGGAQASP